MYSLVLQGVRGQEHSGYSGDLGRLCDDSHDHLHWWILNISSLSLAPRSMGTCRLRAPVPVLFALVCFSNMPGFFFLRRQFLPKRVEFNSGK